MDDIYSRNNKKGEKMDTTTMTLTAEFATPSCYAMLQDFAPWAAARSGEDSILEIEALLADAPVTDDD